MRDYHIFTDEQKRIGHKIIDLLRPEHLTVYEIRKALQFVDEALDFIQLREKVEE